MEIRWSHSADWLWNICHRKFWFKHIHAIPWANWGTPQRKAYILSNAMTLELWRGNLVHSVIADFIIPNLSNVAVLSEESVKNFALERAYRQLEFSANKKYREPNMTKKKAGDAYAIIWEDEFTEPVSRMTKDEALNDIELALSKCMNLSELLEEIRRSSWVVPEATLSLRTNQNATASIAITGRVDLMMADETISNTLTLIDWKVDSRRQFYHAPQLWLYAFLFDKIEKYQDTNWKEQVIPKWVKSLPKKLLTVNLLYGEISEIEWNDWRKMEVEDRAFKGVRRINILLDGRKPDSIEGSELSVAENAKNCEICSFRQPCQKL